MTRAQAACVVWLAALLSGCGVSGPPTGGVLPEPADLHNVASTARHVLAAPAGWTPSPSLISPVYHVPAAELFNAMQQLMLSKPRTWLTVAYPQQNEAFFIVRSVLLNFPDIVVVQAIPVSATTSQAVILSQSRYGGLPWIGVNKARVRELLNMLSAKFASAL